MQEHENFQFDDLAQILQKAHLRRSADLALWLKQYFRERQIKAQAASFHAPDGIVSVGGSIGHRAA